MAELVSGDEDDVHGRKLSLSLTIHE
jgi:hypothetical protein